MSWFIKSLHLHWPSSGSLDGAGCETVDVGMSLGWGTWLLDGAGWEMSHALLSVSSISTGAGVVVLFSSTTYMTLGLSASGNIIS